jgi:hypothetical protein
MTCLSPPLSPLSFPLYLSPSLSISLYPSMSSLRPSLSLSPLFLLFLGHLTSHILPIIKIKYYDLIEKYFFVQQRKGRQQKKVKIVSLVNYFDQYY